jgi:hypothetical protein
VQKRGECVRMSKHLSSLLIAATLALAVRASSLSAAQTWNCPMQRAWCGSSDGKWWQQLSAQAKTAVVTGMISSYELAYGLAEFSMYSYWLTVYESDPDQQRKSQYRKVMLADKGPVFSKSAASYVAAINSFYARYPAKINFKVTGLLRCLQDHPEATCDEIGKSDLLPWPTGP